MHDFPHQYGVTATMRPEEAVVLESSGLDNIASAPPKEFGGPGDQWSPETLLVAAVADCFVLSFRAIATASRFEWRQLGCEVTGTLDRPDGVIQFTAFDVRVTLTCAPGTDEAKARKLLEKSERACLITNSLKAGTTLHISLREEN